MEKKKEGIWRLKLDDMASYDHEDKGYVGANYAAKPRSKADRYIDLHERLGHQSWKVIAEMLDKDNPLCIRAGITAREVKEFRREVHLYRVYVVKAQISVRSFRWFSRRIKL